MKTKRLSNKFSSARVAEIVRGAFGSVSLSLARRKCKFDNMETKNKTNMNKLNKLFSPSTWTATATTAMLIGSTVVAFADEISASANDYSFGCGTGYISCSQEVEYMGYGFYVSWCCPYPKSPLCLYSMQPSADHLVIQRLQVGVFRCEPLFSFVHCKEECFPPCNGVAENYGNKITLWFPCWHLRPASHVDSRFEDGRSRVVCCANGGNG